MFATFTHRVYRPKLSNSRTWASACVRSLLSSKTHAQVNYTCSAIIYYNICAPAKITITTGTAPALHLASWCGQQLDYLMPCNIAMPTTADAGDEEKKEKKECNDVRIRSERFFSLMLDIKGMTTLEECLHQYVKPEVKQSYKNIRKLIIRRSSHILLSHSHIWGSICI